MADDPQVERRLTEEEAQFAAEHNLREFEVDRWSWPEGVFPHREEELELLDRYDLGIHCVGYWGPDYLNPAVEDEVEAHLGRALEYSDVVDASVFVTGASIPEGMDEETAWDQGISFYGELIDRLADHDLTAAFYLGHGNTLLSNLEKIRRFTDELPDATLKVDVANLLGDSIDPIRLLNEFGDRVGHVHLKDTVLLRQDDNVKRIDSSPPGLGDVPWGSVLDLLYLGEYDGMLSIEPHGHYWGHTAHDRPRRQGIRIAQEHIARLLKPEDRPDIE